MDAKIKLIKFKCELNDNPYFKIYYKKLQIIQLYNKIRNVLKEDDEIFKELYDVYKKDNINYGNEITRMFNDMFKTGEFEYEHTYADIAYHLSLLKSMCIDNQKLLDFCSKIGGKYKELLKYIIINKDDKHLLEF